MAVDSTDEDETAPNSGPPESTFPPEHGYIRRVIPSVAAASLTLGACDDACNEPAPQTDPWSLGGNGSSEDVSGPVDATPPREIPRPEDAEEPAETMVPDGEDEPDAQAPPDIRTVLSNACAVAEDCNPEVFYEEYDDVEECEKKSIEAFEVQREYWVEQGGDCLQLAKRWLRCHLSSLQCIGDEQIPYTLNEAMDWGLFRALYEDGASNDKNCTEENPREREACE